MQKMLYVYIKFILSMVTMKSYAIKFSNLVLTVYYILQEFA